MKLSIQGVIVAVLTPFTEGGRIDEKAFINHVDYLIKEGINGIFIAGTTGLGPALSIDEKKRLIDLSSQFIGRGVYVIAHITSLAIKESIDLAKYASRRELTAVSITSPYFYKDVDETSIYEFIKNIAKESSIPVFIYNQPRYTGINIGVDLIRKLREELNNIIGIKDSSGNIIQTLEFIQALGNELIILTGSDALFYPSLTIGAKGIVSALANIIPRKFVELYKKYLEGNYREALEIQKYIIKVRNILRKYSQLSAYYEAARLLGLNVGYPRLPIRRLSHDELERLRVELKKVGIVKT